jgi:hypothetical protein
VKSNLSTSNFPKQGERAVKQRDKRSKSFTSIYKMSQANSCPLHDHMASTLTLKQKKGLDAQWSSGLRVAGARNVWEQEVGEVLGKHISSSGGERVRAIHRLLVFDTDRDDVA